MKIHTTNYINTFIEVAADCPVEEGEIPPLRGDKKSIAAIQFELIDGHPYEYTSDDVLFQCFVLKEALKGNLEEAREHFFSKGEACLRSSPLTKRYGWGIHSNGEGKIALFGVNTSAYKGFIQDENLMVVKAMRSKRM